jgi:hypothetical protein
MLWYVNSPQNLNIYHVIVKKDRYPQLKNLTNNALEISVQHINYNYKNRTGSRKYVGFSEFDDMILVCTLASVTNFFRRLYLRREPLCNIVSWDRIEWLNLAALVENEEESRKFFQGEYPNAIGIGLPGFRPRVDASPYMNCIDYFNRHVFKYIPENDNAQWINLRQQRLLHQQEAQAAAHAAAAERQAREEAARVYRGIWGGAITKKRKHTKKSTNKKQNRTQKRQ